MKDVSTVAGDSTAQHHRRSPSPGVITSRRGRSRSPVASRPPSRPDASLSRAAIAAGRAAIAVRHSPLEYSHHNSHHHRRSPSPPSASTRPRSRSPNERNYYEGGGGTVNKWPSGSFDMSPIQGNLSLGSFDWNMGMEEKVTVPQQPVEESRYHHHHRRYPSPLMPEMRYDAAGQPQSYDYPPQEYGYYEDRHRYERYPHDRHSRHPEGGGQHHHRPHDSPQYHRRHGRETSKHHHHQQHRQHRSSSQPLYSEHHILSTSTYEEEKRSYHNHHRNHPYGRQSSSAFRDAPTPTADNSRGRSVFRGVEDGEYKSNVVTALRSVEDDHLSEVGVVTAKKEEETNKKRKRGAGAAAAGGSATKTTKAKGKGKKKETKKTKSKGSELPKELLLDDESPPVSPQKNAAASPTNIDKELSAIGMDNLDVMLPGVSDDNYLSNLSFRKSYDLEQMFSFMKSPKSSMKDELKFGSMSFSNSFLMSGSCEENDGMKDGWIKNDLKMRSTSQQQQHNHQQHHHRRQPSSFSMRRSSRSSPLGIPTIHTLTSQNSSLGLTPINSFSGDHGPIVPLTSHDGMALTAMFAASPMNVPEGSGEALPPPVVMQQGPPPPLAYNNEYYRQDARGPPPPSSANTPPLGSIPAPMSLNKRVKLTSMRSPGQLVMDVTKRADLYVLLKKLAPAFAGFRFKLPEVDLSLSPEYVDGAHLPSQQQVVIAKRRVNSSICAFGGSVPRRTVSFESDTELTPDQKKDQEEKKAYEKDLSSRYFMKEHCISWDVEQHDVIIQKDSKGEISKGKEDLSSSKYCAPVTPSTPNNHDLNSNTSIGIREKGKKVKYRCKLCGQPKQNHTCPYTSTVMRSIGTMVYPAVNAFVSDEPGKLAPALSEMNNFTSLLSQDMSASTRDYRPYNNGFNVLTPDSHWSPNTPGAMSAISTPSTPGNRKRDHLLMSRTMSGVSHAGGASDNDCLFRGTMELKPEQYRRVRFKADPKDDAYHYPDIPTPYSQRKEMGDTLFELSREVPKLADSCAAILRNARENDCWDQAVAELTTQVLIVLRCDEQDYTLEGVRRHLLTLGIAC